MVVKKQCDKNVTMFLEKVKLDKEYEAACERNLLFNFLRYNVSLEAALDEELQESLLDIAYIYSAKTRILKKILKDRGFETTDDKNKDLLEPIIKLYFKKHINKMLKIVARTSRGKMFKLPYMHEKLCKNILDVLNATRAEWANEDY